MFLKKFHFLFLLLLISGCTISFQGSGTSNNLGGVFASSNNGDTWKQMVLIPTVSGSPGSISGLDTKSFALDPGDSNAIYFGSIENGLYYTYNNTKEWHFVEDLGKVTVRNITIDPDDKCTIYVAVDNKLYKSEDCNRSWDQVYYDNDEEVLVNSIAIDHYDSNIVYISTSRGEVIKSFDKGVSWQTVGRFDNSVSKIVISPHDSRIIFVATVKKGIFRTFDSGENWKNLNDNMEEFDDALKFRDLVLASDVEGKLFLANDYGLLVSDNNGESWRKIELITPEDDAIINSIAVSPQNSDEIYYVTNTTFYRSSDGGDNWTTKKLPTSRAGWRLLINLEDDDIIYLGIRDLE